MSKSTIISIAITGVAIVLAFQLNPSSEKHRASIKKAIAERSQIAKVLGVGALTAFASTYHSVGIASYTTVGEKTVSFGAFGMVFVSE